MTTRIQPVEVASASGPTKEVLDQVKAKLGRVPNIFQLMAQSPAAVKGYLDFSEALSHGVLSAKLREEIAITVAEVNRCEYCLSAHYAIGKSIGMTETELENARLERSTDPKSDAALTFVRSMLQRKGDITEASIDTLKSVNMTDAEISEIIANVALNVFTNYFNLYAKTEVDFPRIPTAFPA